jgi:hypothetical protein
MAEMRLILPGYLYPEARPRGAAGTSVLLTPQNVEAFILQTVRNLISP